MMNSRIKLERIFAAIFILLCCLYFFQKPSADDFGRYADSLRKGEPISILGSFDLFRDLYGLPYKSQAENFRDLAFSDDANKQDTEALYSPAAAWLACHPDDAKTLMAFAEVALRECDRNVSQKLSMRALQLSPHDLFLRREMDQLESMPPDSMRSLDVGTLSIIERRLKNLEAIMPLKRIPRIGYEVKSQYFDLMATAPQDYLDFVFRSDVELRDEYSELRNFEIETMDNLAFNNYLRNPDLNICDAEDFLEDHDPERALGWDHRATLAFMLGDIPEAVSASARSVEMRPWDEHRIKRHEVLEEFSKDGTKQGDSDLLSLYQPWDPEYGDKEFFLLGVHINDGAASKEYKAIDNISSIVSSAEPGIPGVNVSDYPLPDDETLNQLIAHYERDSKRLEPCPVVMPFISNDGNSDSLGAWLACLTMIRSSYAPRELLSIPNVLEVFYQRWFFGQRHGADSADIRLLQGIFQTPAVAIVKLATSSRGYKVTLTLNGSRSPKSFERHFQTGQLHLIPSWVALKVHGWLGTSLSAAEKKICRDPLLMMTRAFWALYREF